MLLLSDGDRQRIADAITAAEATTSGEIVAVIAPQSGSYLYMPLLAAALVALAVPFPFIFWTWWPVQHIYLLQLVTFGGIAAGLMPRPLRMALVPSSIKRAQAHARAVEQFLAQDLYTTPGRTGVLIFVSAAERYAEIIADAAIHAKVPESAWKGIVDDLTAQIGAGQAGDGFVSAIEAIRRHLADHFPPGSRNPNALPNHLIVLPAI
jgi:putative membrane protein